MKKFLISLLCASLLFGCASCSSEKETPKTGESNEEASIPSENVSKDEPSSADVSEEPSEEISAEESEIPASPINVLFVGNSFTYYNDLPVIFENVVNSAGIEANVQSVTVGSARLEWFNDPSQSISKDFTKAIDGTVFDLVFLQEHSTRPYKDYDAFSAGITALCGRIREKSPDADIVLYETWGFNENYSSLKNEKMTTEEQEALLLEAYAKAGKEHSLKVSYAGMAHLAVYRETEYDPYHTDLKHPSYIGSFASALTHFYTLFPGAARDSVTFRGELSEKEFEDISQIAYNVAHDDSIGG